MAVTYVKKYLVDRTIWGIEDYEDGRPADEHFFPEDRSSRFQLWRGGCGTGTCDDTLSTAQEILKNLITSDLQARRDQLVDELSKVNSLLTRARTVGVATFEVKP